MRIFHCQSCTAVVYFENVRCLSCGSELGYCPDLQELSALTATPDGRWQVAASRTPTSTYRKCRNFTAESACNWMIAPDDPHEYCRSCALTRTVPDLDQPTQRQCWIRLEAAKRRLLYGLIQLHLPIVDREHDPDHGLCFDFCASTPGHPVMTGHDRGVITVNSAEADDAQREASKAALGEAYRTVLGHLRHESGHYYWDILLANGRRLDGFRAIFGDERHSYEEAQQQYYRNGPRPDWKQHGISAYASMHPWEDWAETWSHYLHIRDVIEIGGQFHLSLRPERARSRATTVRLSSVEHDAFDQIIEAWIPVTCVINSLNRSMGLPDFYPFILSGQAISKLRFVHEVITSASVPVASQVV